MKKITSQILAGGLLAIGLCMTSSVQAQYNFYGNYVAVGIGQDGSIINDTAATQTSVPGQPFSPYLGIAWDGTGSGNFSVNNDMITPGSPFQFNAVGYGGGYGTASYELNGSSGLGATTVNTSAGGVYSALTTGAYGSLGYQQAMTFVPSSQVIHFDMTLKNNSASSLANVVFATGFDPDPDVYQYEDTPAGAATDVYNSINDIVSSSVVSATGPLTGNTILIQGLTAGDVATVSPWWDSDPDDLATPGGGGFSTVGFVDNADYTIDMGWNIGTLAPDQSVDIQFNYIVNGTPVTPTSPVLSSPDMGSTLAMLGMALFGLNFGRRIITGKRG